MADADVWRRGKAAVGHRALAGGLAVELGWCLYAAGSRLRTPAARDLGYSLGYQLAAALSVALLAWMVVYFGFVRRSAPERGRPYLFGLLAFALVVQAAAVLLLQTAVAAERTQVRTAAQEVEAAVAAVQAAPETAKIDVRPKASGDAGELERLIKTSLAELQKDHLEYVVALRAAGVPEVLTAQTVAGDAGLQATRAGLAQGRALVKTYQARYHGRKAELREAIARSRLSLPAKGLVLAMFDRAARRADQGETFWSLEDAYLAEMDAAAADLQHPQGRWTVRGDEIDFSEPADLQAFYRHVADLQALFERKASLRDETLRQAKSEIELMRGAL